MPKPQPVDGCLRDINLAYLNPNLDLNDVSYGLSSYEWRADWSANFIALRSDGENLTPEELEKLCHFCMVSIGNRILLNDTPKKGNAILSSLNSEGFRRVWKELFRDRILQMHSAVQAAVPTLNHSDNEKTR